VRLVHPLEVDQVQGCAHRHHSPLSRAKAGPWGFTRGA
jgi:hypothetical protein